jgi:transcriptional regulator with XRE-family HTH domain
VPRNGDIEGGIVYWLAEVCRERREEQDLYPVQVAAAVRLHPSSITRFERHETAFAGLERLVAAYAIELGIPARELWLAAIEAWQAGGLSA